MIGSAFGSGLLLVLLSVTWMAKRWAPLGPGMMLGSVWHLRLRSALVKAATRVRWGQGD